MENSRNEYFGEVLGSTTASISGDCYELGILPAYGGLIVTDGDYAVVAVISSVEIGSVLPGRTPIARGLSPAELEREHPEMTELIVARFEAKILGINDSQSNTISLVTPKYPPPLYSRAAFANQSHYSQLSALPEPGRRIFAVTGSDDRLFCAVIREIAGNISDSRGFIDRLARELASLLADDYRRLESILKDIEV